MSDPQPWIFTQLDGDNLQIILTGATAPHGRPRQKPVVEEELKQRIATHRYPGNSGSPTRHFFGDEWSDMTLTGRWMDKDIDGKGSANNFADAFYKFIQGRQLCTIAWGNIVQYTGVIESLKISRESDAQLAWTMHILVDERDSLPSPLRPLSPEFQSQIAEMTAKMDLAYKAPALEVAQKDWSPDLLDQIDTLISDINVVSATVLGLANGISNIKDATLGELNRLRGGFNQLKTALITYTDVMTSIPIDVANFTRSADSDITTLVTLNNQGLYNSDLLAILADLNRTTEIAIIGKQITSYVAKSGDDWEGISILAYGGPERAADIRRANGVKYGNLPVAGVTYKIPA